VLFRRVAARRIGTSGRRFPSLFDGGCENSRAATHVDSHDGVLSDAGSTPAASTTHSLALVRGVGGASRLRTARSRALFSARLPPRLRAANSRPPRSARLPPRLGFEQLAHARCSRHDSRRPSLRAANSRPPRSARLPSLPYSTRSRSFVVSAARLGFEPHRHRCDRPISLVR